jgi:hypothetical protein
LGHVAADVRNRSASRSRAIICRDNSPKARFVMPTADRRTPERDRLEARLVGQRGGDALRFSIQI